LNSIKYGDIIGVMKRIQPLTIKRKKYVKEYAETGNGTQSAMNSFNFKDKRTASNYSVELLKKPLVKKSIEAILNKSGLDLESISSPLQSIIHAPVKDVKPSDTLRALDMAYKLHNAYPPSKSLSARFNITKKYEDMKYDDVLKELETIRHKTNKLMNDTEAS